MTTIEDMVLEALDQLAGQIHDRVLDETGDPGAHDARLWQRIRDSLETRTRSRLEVTTRGTLDRERIARARANGIESEAPRVEAQMDDLRFAVDLPNPEPDQEMICIDYFPTEAEAIAFTQEYFGADAQGRVQLVSEMPAETDDERQV